MDEQSVANEQIQETVIPRIPVDLIVKDDSFNCRGPISPSSVFELATDIAHSGLHQAVGLRPLTATERLQYPGRLYALYFGFRRMTAALALQWKDIPAVIRNISPDEAKIFNLTENLHRTDLTLWQECQTIKELHDRGMTRQAISDATCLPMGRIQRWQNILKMPKAIQEMVEAGILGVTHVQQLFSYEDEDELLEVAAKIRENYQAKGGTPGFQLKIPKPLKAKKDNLTKKKFRKPDDILNFMRYMRSVEVPQCLVYRVLAWAAGQISDLEVMTDLKEEVMEIYGIKIDRPATEGIPDMPPL